ERKESRGELTAREVKPDVPDVSIPPSVHDDVVPGTARERTQVGMHDHRAVGLPPEQPSLGRRYDEQAPVSKPVDAKWKRRHARDDLAPALEIDGNQLLGAPVAEPQTIIVPARRLTEGDASHQHAQFRHGRLLRRHRYLLFS